MISYLHSQFYTIQIFSCDCVITKLPSDSHLYSRYVTIDYSIIYITLCCACVVQYYTLCGTPKDL